MKKLVAIPLFLSCFISFGQSQKISTIDFVQILNENREEAIYYYENNWLILRKMAMQRGYIASYEVIETAATEEAPFHLILKTTYANQADFDQAEDRFQKLIEEKGPLMLLNEKKPGEFRKTIFSKIQAKHLF